MRIEKENRNITDDAEYTEKSLRTSIHNTLTRARYRRPRSKYYDTRGNNRVFSKGGMFASTLVGFCTAKLAVDVSKGGRFWNIAASV